MSVVFKERFQKSAMQYSSGFDISVRKLINLLWRNNTHNHISSRQLHHKISLENDLTLLDIRTQKAFDKGHIKTAINIPLRKLILSDQDLPFSKGTKIVVICYLGVSSREAIFCLAEQGYKKLINLDGGMGAWDYEKTITTN
jgi:rhodanese-related sulfurtransferase